MGLETGWNCHISLTPNGDSPCDGAPSSPGHGSLHEELNHGACWYLHKLFAELFEICIYRHELSCSLQLVFLNQGYEFPSILALHLEITLEMNGPLAIWPLNICCITNHYLRIVGLLNQDGCTLCVNSQTKTGILQFIKPLQSLLLDESRRELDKRTFTVKAWDEDQT